MEYQTITSNGYSWDSLSMFQTKMKYAVNNKLLANQIRIKLKEYRSAKGIDIAYKDGTPKEIIIVIFPTQTIEGKALTQHIVNKTIEEVWVEILEAKRQKELLDILI